MKHKFIAAAIAATAIVSASCDWFQSESNEIKNPLIGQWKIDSLTVGKDTSGAFVLALLVAKDQAVLEFKKDTIVTMNGNDSDTSFYKWYEKEMKVMPADTVEGAFQYARLNDSTVTLTSKDSTVLFLQKK